MHCTLANIASGLIGIGLGYGLHSAISASVKAGLRDTIEARDAAHVALTERLLIIKRNLGLANAEIIRLTPWAEKGRKRQAALDKARAAKLAAVKQAA